MCPVFKKEFAFDTAIKRARLHISTLGIYEARINGVRVGEDYMAPGWTVYPKRLQYFTYEVGHMLGAQNAIEVGVGNGWYSSRGGFVHTADGMYGEYPELILALEVWLDDGRRQIIVTDDSRLASPSEVLFSSLYDGETVNAMITSTTKTIARQSHL